MSEGIRNEGVLPVERKVSAIRAIDSQTNDALEKLMKEIERTSLFTKVEADEIIEAIKEIQSLRLRIVDGGDIEDKENLYAEKDSLIGVLSQFVVSHAVEETTYDRTSTEYKERLIKAITEKLGEITRIEGFGG